MTPQALADLHRAAFLRERPWGAAEFADLLANPHTHLTAQANGFALWRAVAGEAELLTIAVAPAAQGQGIGTVLMQAWLEEAEAVCETAFLEVASDNAPALALYQRHGFATVATRTGYYARDGAHADALVMRRPSGVHCARST